GARNIVTRDAWGGWMAGPVRRDTRGDVCAADVEPGVLAAPAVHSTRLRDELHAAGTLYRHLRPAGHCIERPRGTGSKEAGRETHGHRGVVGCGGRKRAAREGGGLFPR